MHLAVERFVTARHDLISNAAIRLLEGMFKKTLLSEAPEVCYCSAQLKEDTSCKPFAVQILMHERLSILI